MPTKHELEVETELADIVARWPDDVRAVAFRLLYRDGWRVDENAGYVVKNVVRGDA